MSKAIALALLAHQISSCYFLGVEDIFPENNGFITSRTGKRSLYFIMAIIALILALIPNKVATLIRKKKVFQT